MKFLLWGLIVFIVVMWLTRGNRMSRASNTVRREASGTPLNGEQMVQCAHCGTHIPMSESICTPSGTVFCSEEHRLQHAKA